MKMRKSAQGPFKSLKPARGSKERNEDDRSSIPDYCQAGFMPPISKKYRRRLKIMILNSSL